jgi:hypothetical protein
MSRESTTSIGSGTVPHLAVSPALEISNDTFPIPSHRHNLKTRTGENVVMINIEDFSVFIGMNQQAVSVSSSALPLPANPLEFRRALVIHNNGGSTLYIGGSNVTTANGFPLAANEKISIDIQNNESVTVYGISAGTSDVRLLELA